VNGLTWKLSAGELAAELEHAVSIGDAVPRTKKLLQSLRQALSASLADSGPRQHELIVGLLSELDALEPQLDTGRIRWLGGIERQCRIIRRCGLQ
jgi:hypothetical protein